jgi:hypothetical protein
VASKPKAARGRPGTLPTREQILEFLSTEAKAGKREIARAFGIKGGDRIALKQLLAEMAASGEVLGGRNRVRVRGSLPPVTVLEIVGRDDDGDLIAEPVVWESEDGPRPRVLIVTRRPTADGTQPGIGDRVLARITKLEEPDVEGLRFEAEPIRPVPRESAGYSASSVPMPRAAVSSLPSTARSSGTGGSRAATRAAHARATSCASTSLGPGATASQERVSWRPWEIRAISARSA